MVINLGSIWEGRGRGWDGGGPWSLRREFIGFSEGGQFKILLAPPMLHLLCFRWMWGMELWIREGGTISAALSAFQQTFEPHKIEETKQAIFIKYDINGKDQS